MNPKIHRAKPTQDAKDVRPAQGILSPQRLPFRHAACCILERDPVYQEWDGQGGSPLAYVVGCNLTCRNLTPSQRAAIALDVKDRLSEEYRERQTAGLKKGAYKPTEPRSGNNSGTGEAREQAAAMMQVSPRYVQNAQKIREQAPHVFDAVKAGEITIPQAKREIRKQASSSTPTESAITSPCPWLTRRPLTSSLT